MPEIKHTFQGGKMNKDLDERLVPNGEYRDAMNIQVITTDGDAAGTVQNIKGNFAVDSVIEGTSYSNKFINGKSKIITSIADEKNDKAYFFVSAPEWGDVINDYPLGISAAISAIIAVPKGIGEIVYKDYILEVSSGGAFSNPMSIPIVVDIYAIISPYLITMGQQGSTTLSLPTEDFVTFSVIDASKYRIGMNVQALNSNGVDQFNAARIKSIDTVNNTITLSNEQEGFADSSVVDLFIFENPDRPLNFNSETIITGISIIDDLLFWTDNRSEPKKINITRCKDGTNADGNTHTKLKLHDPQTGDLELMSDMGESLTNMGDIEVTAATPINDDLREEHVTVKRKAPTTAPTLTMSKSTRVGKTYAEISGVDDNNNPVGFSFISPSQEDGQAIGPVQSGDTISIGVYTDFEETSWQANDILTFVATDAELDINQTPIAVRAKFISYLIDDGDGNIDEPSDVPSSTIQVLIIATHSDLTTMPHVWDVSLELKKPLFEKSFGRFGYRYKYEDGEYSSFSPWSELAFLPGRFDYSVRKGYNLGMINEVRELVVKDFIPINTDRSYDVKCIDILYKSTDSSSVHIVKTIDRRVDSQWQFFTPGEDNDTMVTGELHITSDMIHRTIPSNQILRSWDNVPRYALAQEITANRLIYGNYTQGYNIDFDLDLTPSLESLPNASPDDPRKSIKSDRKYKIGVVFGDKYGRETPVIESSHVSGNDSSSYFNSTGDVEVPKRFAYKQNSFNVAHDWGQRPPKYFDYIKYYVKETSSEYYNLVMDRWYQARDGNIWLSFPSADRNKVDLETYLILKNANGEDTPVEEEARYKIIAIENQAPDFIKIDHRFFNPIFLDPDSMGSSLFDAAISVETSPPTLLMRSTSFDMPLASWNDLMSQYTNNGNLRIRFVGKTQTVTGVTLNEIATKWVSLSHFQVGSWSEFATISWNDQFDDEVDMQQRFTDAGYDKTGLRYFLEIKEEVIENKPEFDGRFFVLVERDVTLDAQIIKKAPFTTSWIQTGGIHHLAYIDTRRFNPAVSGPHSKAGADAYHDTFTGSPTDLNIQELYEWGRAKTYNYSDDGTTASISFNSNLDWPKNTFDPVCGIGQFGNVLGFDCSSSSGMKPTVTDFALGGGRCDDYVDGTGENFQESAWAACNAEFTKQFWTDWNAFIKNEVTWGRGETKKWDYVFIDAARSALWQWDVNSEVESTLGISSTSLAGVVQFYYDNNDLNVLHPHAFAWNFDCAADAFTAFGCDDEAYIESSSNDYLGAGGHGREIESPIKASGRYYKPWGLDRDPKGVQSNDQSPNRLVFSIISNSTWDGDANSNNKHERFKGNMVPGNYFQFPSDPDKNIYRVRYVQKTNAPEGHGYTIEQQNVSNIINIGATAGLYEMATDNATANYMEFFAGEYEGMVGGRPTYLRLISPANLADKSPEFAFGDDDNFNFYEGAPSVTSQEEQTDYTNPDNWIMLGMDYDVASAIPLSDGNFAASVPLATWGTGKHSNVTSPAEDLNSIFNDSGDVSIIGESVGAADDGYPNGGTDGGTRNRFVRDGCLQHLRNQTSRRQSIRVTFDLVDQDTGSPYLSGESNFGMGIDLDRFDPRGQVRHDGTTTLSLTFMAPSTTGGGTTETMSNLSACWETEPKENVDLDLYYEASDAIPLRLQQGNTLAFAPINSLVGSTNRWQGEKTNVSFKYYNANASGIVNFSNGSTNSYDHHVKNVFYTSSSSLIEVGAKAIINDVETEIVQKASIGIGSHISFLNKNGVGTTSKVTDFYNYENGVDVVPATRYEKIINYHATQIDSYFDRININNSDDTLHSMLIIGDGVPPGVYLKKYYNTNYPNNSVYKISNKSWMTLNSDGNIDPTVNYAVELVMSTGLYEIDSNVYEYDVKLGWHNCYSFGNGVESDRIGDDFNASQIDNGVKVSTTFTGYKEEYKTSGLIHSGLYNSTSEVNDLNEFNMAEKITKDLNPSYGSIQAMKTRDTDVVVFTEDKVLKVLASKDALFNADGNPQLVATNRTLGQAIPFVGDYGISKNPESLAWDQFRMYFSDVQRGSILRLSRDGLTPISNVGMKTYFRDNLKKAAKSVLGTFDTVNEEYNVTLLGEIGSNLTPTTLSFNERSRGWVSFKSFVPQAGVSVSDKYFTAVEDTVYEHYVPGYEDEDETVCNYDYCVARNTFYGETTESSITMLFNDVPGSVKSFKAINYEGSQARVNVPKFTGTEEDAAGNSLDLFGGDLPGDGEYYNINSKKGWYVDYFETDMQSATVIDFINKENKWFNKIQGIATTVQNLDTNEFSVQGLGQPTGVVVITNENEIITAPTPSYDSIYTSGQPVMGENSYITIFVSTTNVEAGTKFKWSTDLTELYNGSYNSVSRNDFSAFAENEGGASTCWDNEGWPNWSSFGNSPDYGQGEIGENGIGSFKVGICQDYITESGQNEVFLVSITESDDGTSTTNDSNQPLTIQISVVDTSTGSGTAPAASPSELDGNSDEANVGNSNPDINQETNFTLNVEDKGDDDKF